MSTPPPPPPVLQGTIPLSHASVGQEFHLVRLEGGREFQHRLAEMGLLPGVRFRVINRSRMGPFIISVKDTRLMLGHGVLARVTVRPV